MSLQFNKIQYPLLAPTDTVTEPKGLSVEDTIDFLKDDDVKDDIISLDDKDDKKDETKDKSGKTKEKDDEGIKDEKEDEVDEDLKAIEDELEEPTDEQLELVTPVRRKEILSKYPKLFKDFPYLEKAYYREQQFTELLPTIDDAKQAVEKSGILDKFEADLIDGNIERMLLAAKSNEKGFTKIADNYLSTLSKVDEKAYLHVIGNVIKHTIINMVQESRSSGNEALQSAAQILNQYAFGSSEFKPITRLSKDEQPDTKVNELNEREQKFNQQRFESANNDLSSRVNNAYKSTIEANIDPKQSMSDYVRKTASREALENLESLISKDGRFKILVDKLWEAAIKDDFSKSSTDRIRSAFVSKAKTLLPSVIQKARNEALKGMGKRVTSDKTDDNETEITDTKTRTRESSRSSNKSDQSKKGIPKGMSSLEFLMSDD